MFFIDFKCDERHDTEDKYGLGNGSSGEIIDDRKEPELNWQGSSTDRLKQNADSPIRVHLKKQMNLNLSVDVADSRRRSDLERRSCVGYDFDTTKVDKKKAFGGSVCAEADTKVREGELYQEEFSDRELGKSKFAAEAGDNGAVTRNSSRGSHRDPVLPSKCKIIYVH